MSVWKLFIPVVLGSLTVGVGVGYAVLQSTASRSGGVHENAETDSSVHNLSSSSTVRLHSSEQLQTPKILELPASLPLPETDDAGHSTSPRRPKPGTASAMALETAKLLEEEQALTPELKLQRADRLLLGGNYKSASSAYAQLKSSHPSYLPAELQLRIALCEEGLGNQSKGIAAYRSVLDHNPAPVIRQTAILGQVRILGSTNRHDLATSMLFGEIVKGTLRHDPESQAQVTHQLAVLVSARIVGEGIGKEKGLHELNDETLLTPQLAVHPYQVLDELMSRPIVQVANPEIPPYDISVVQRFNQSADEIYVNVRTERLTALELVKRAVNRAGWKVKITEEARLKLQESALQPDCVNMPLAVVLDAILDPVETVWKVDGETMYISVANQATIEEMQTHRLKSANRWLKFACLNGPEHPWAPASFLELARTMALKGNLVEASDCISKMLQQFPRSEFEAIGWLNLGKLSLRLGRLNEALKAFHQASDLLAGHPLEAVSYLYAGRVCLESDQIRESISPLTRAKALSEGSRFQAIATLQLVAAYYLLDNYQVANEILLAHHSLFEGEGSHDLAATLTWMIQLKSTLNEYGRTRAGTSLIAALTNTRTSDCFGGHWAWIIGSAYRETGMVQEAISIFRNCLQSSYSFPLQNRIRQCLLEDAPDQLAGIESAQPINRSLIKPSSLLFQTQLKEAATGFHRGDVDTSIRKLHRLLEHPQVADADRRAALRLLGQIYQSKSEHKKAVECFSGVVPTLDLQESVQVISDSLATGPRE
ncbi:hypothetical protein SH668x_000818 [Planctomicrobium sp. SH668]|uniref:hypothetical protein n=1 Tax=Planctomicrobium sp. SH668 TaxID=3448126 RepID=UPI003F5C0C88